MVEGRGALKNVLGNGLGFGQTLRSRLLDAERRPGEHRADGVDLYVGTYGHTVLAQLLRSSDEDEDADEEEDEDEDEDEASSTSITPCLSPMSPMSPVAPWGGALPGKEPPSMPPATDPASPPSSEPPWWCRTTPPRGKDTPSLSPRKSEFRLRCALPCVHLRGRGVLLQ